MAGPRRTRYLLVVGRPDEDGDPLARMLAADERAVQAGHRLLALRSRAFSGEGYDSEAYDAAILAHRAAQDEARTARLAWARRREQDTEAARAA